MMVRERSCHGTQPEPPLKTRFPIGSSNSRVR